MKEEILIADLVRLRYCLRKANQDLEAFSWVRDCLRFNKLSDSDRFKLEKIYFRLRKRPGRVW